jgi:hypothetical protein
LPTGASASVFPQLGIASRQPQGFFAGNPPLPESEAAS